MSRITFESGYLPGLHVQSLTWPIALGELCDNSFDAGATRIELNFGANRILEVSDDGDGCADIEGMFTFGRHMQQPTTSLGRWGVGLKDTATWLWGEIHIYTNHKATGIIRKAFIDWDKVSKTPSMDYANPIQKKADANDLRGTKLIFRNISKDRKLPPPFERIKDELSFFFTPALKEGRQIVIRTVRGELMTCAAWVPPQLTDVVFDEFSVNGKQVKIYAGIVPTGIDNSKSGFSFFHKHRIIFNSHLGANGHSVSRICGIVNLKQGWTLGKNKTNIIGDEEALEEAIWSRCQTIVLKAEQQANVIRNDKIQSQVSESLQGLLRGNGEKEQRDKGKKHGTVIPIGTKKTRDKIKKTQPGNRITRANQFFMEWRPRNDELVGEVAATLKSCIVYLNSNHPRLAMHQANSNVEALVDNCLWLICHAAEGKEPTLPGILTDEGTMVERLSALLAANKN